MQLAHFPADRQQTKLWAQSSWHKTKLYLVFRLTHQHRLILLTISLSCHSSLQCYHCVWFVYRSNYGNTVCQWLLAFVKILPDRKTHPTALPARHLHKAKFRIQCDNNTIITFNSTRYRTQLGWTDHSSLSESRPIQEMPKLHLNKWIIYVGLWGHFEAK